MRQLLPCQQLAAARRRTVRIKLIVLATLIALLSPLVGAQSGEERNADRGSNLAWTPDAGLEDLLAAIESVDQSFAADLRRDVRQVIAASPERDNLGASSVLDGRCLLEVTISPESRVKVDPGTAAREFRPGHWRTYLVKVTNQARVTSPLRASSPQFSSQTTNAAAADRRWLEFEMIDLPPLTPQLSGRAVEYRAARVRTHATGKRSAIIAMDVGQGTADIGFRNDVVLTFASVSDDDHGGLTDGLSAITPRRPRDDAELRTWLENMVWHHRFTVDEVCRATGLRDSEVVAALERFDISARTRPRRGADASLLMLPYPGGRHPRIGFLDGAVNPQRETKASVFLPWDQNSYVVIDAPEAIWSNLGLTYLAHTHIPTIWDVNKVPLPPLEWRRRADGGLELERSLPNGITFGTRLIPSKTAVRMEMWLTNGTRQTLSDLRVQNCVMLKEAAGFVAQTNDNKLFTGGYAVCRNDSGNRWVITAWEPLDRAWGNEECPCLHSDPKFPDCLPGETQRLAGWLSFYEGTDIKAELSRIDSLKWRTATAEKPATHCEVNARIIDASDEVLLPARVTIRGNDGQWHLADSVGGTAIPYRREKPQLPHSHEVHTTLSADPFVVSLAPGQYRFRIERGKEYLPLEKLVTVGTQRLDLTFRLQRWIKMSDRGWYSGDTHVHRSLQELPNVLLAEDLNVALPISHWAVESERAPGSVDDLVIGPSPGLITVDSTHVIHPVNTEYEIYRFGRRQQQLGALLVLNHNAPLLVGAPPLEPVAAAARNQGALLDIDKHTWPWTLVLIPLLDADLFELANNHLWQTSFGLKQWALNTVPKFMAIEQDADGLTEQGWVDFGCQTYYALVNCGFRMRISAGTASGVHPVPLGFNRVYVYCPNGFNYDDWIDGLDEGRSFVSTGPLLDVRFNGQLPGAKFRVSSGQQAKVRITGTAESPQPLDRIEVIVNGRLERLIVPANQPSTSGGFSSVVDESISSARSLWVAVRCFARDPSGRVRFAHTNPAYVDVDGAPLIPRRVEVEYFIGRLEEEMQNNRAILSATSLSEFQRAIKIYRSIAETAE